MSTEKLYDEATEVVAQIVYAMVANGIPIDSCLLAAELARETGRALGHRAGMVPVRVRATHEDGREGRSLGYTESVAADRYNGHVIVVYDGKVALDPTAPQVHREIKPLVFEVPRGFGAKVEHASAESNGWTLDYTAFDDKGDWATGVMSEDVRQAQTIGRLIANSVRRER